MIDYSHGYSHDINNQLRKGKLKSGFTDTVKLLDSMIGKSKLKADSVAYRVIDSKYAKMFKDGMTVRDNAFVSTTKSLSVVQGSSAIYGDDSGDQVVVRINLRKGTKALDINKTQRVDFPGEKELLVARGQKFKVQRTGNNIVLTTI